MENLAPAGNRDALERADAAGRGFLGVEILVYTQCILPGHILQSEITGC